MDFQPKYVHCSRCRTGYAPGMVGPLCPQCGIPFSSVTGTAKDNVSFSTVPVILSSWLPGDIVLCIPGELKEALATFLEIGLASVTAHLEELEEDELQLVELLQNAIVGLEHTEPTAGEVLNHNRALLRGDSVDIEGI